MKIIKEEPAATVPTTTSAEVEVKAVAPASMSGRIVFAFGPHNAYYFHCLNEAVHDNCSRSFRSFTRHIQTPRYIGLGPGEEEYCAMYENDKAADMFQFKHFSESIHLKSLAEITSTVFKVEKVHFSAAGFAFGPKQTFVVSTPSKLTHSTYLPESLLLALTSRTRQNRSTSNEGEVASYYPNQVSLGCDDAWFIRWSDGVSAWDLGKTRAYEGLRMLIGARSEDHTEESKPVVDYLVLDQWHAQHWFCVLDQGQRVEFSLPKSASEKVLPLVQRYLEGMETVSTVKLGYTQPTRAVDEASLPPSYENVNHPRRSGWFSRCFARPRPQQQEMMEKTHMHETV